MASAPVVWADSFMTYSSAEANYWYQLVQGLNPTINNTGGRNGRGSCVPNGGAGGGNLRWIAGASYTTWVCSLALHGPLGGNDNIFVGGYRIVSNGSGILLPAAGGPSWSSPAIPTGQWTHVAIRVYLNATSGTVDIWFNEALVVSVTGNTGGGAANYCGFDGDGGITMSDLVLQASNTATDTPVGDRAVQAFMPSGAGNYTNFALTGAATNWQAVGDAPSDGDTSYVSSSTVGTKDSYALADLPGSAVSIAGVVAKRVARKTDAGTRASAGLVRIAGTDYEGSSENLSTSFSGYYDAYPTSPATSAAWTVSEFNGTEIGEDLSA